MPASQISRQRKIALLLLVIPRGQVTGSYGEKGMIENGDQSLMKSRGASQPLLSTLVISQPGAAQRNTGTNLTICTKNFVRKRFRISQSLGIMNFMATTKKHYRTILSVFRILTKGDGIASPGRMSQWSWLIPISPP